MRTDQEELLGDVEAMQAPPLRTGGQAASRSVAAACAASLVAFALAGMIAFFPDQRRSDKSLADVAQALQGKADAGCDVDTPCTSCEYEGNCDACHAEARLTCCEEAGGSRRKCCEDDAIKKFFPGSGGGNASGDGNDLCKEVCVASDGMDCSLWQCCSKEGHKCFKKNNGYAGCKETCSMTEVDPWDNKTWDCDVLGEVAPTEPLTCATVHENCAEKACCQEATKTCYRKDKYWSGCRDTGTCDPGEPYSADVAPHNTSWNCTAITGTT